MNLYDPAVPGYVGPDGDGSTNGANNYINRAFAGWASSVVDYSPGPNLASEWTNAVRALGPVTGNNMDIVSLGDLDQGSIDSNTAPGSITVAFDIPISDEEGPDLAVFENAFLGGPDVFVELGYVEVSSDGTNFVRFPSVSLTTNAVAPYDAIDAGNVYNLCGKHINAYGDSWGTPFDLSDLACHAMALDGTVDLSAVTHVRIVDIPGSGDFYDAFSPSNAVYDPWPTMGSGGVDLEAVGVINSRDHARINLGINGPGGISPYGLPGPVVAVAHGSNITFSIAAEPGHHILDVRINGASIGVTNGHTFVNVQTDQRLEADFGNILVVQSAYGTATPGIGTNYGYGAMTASVIDSPVDNGATQYACVGWTGSGSVPATGSASNTGEFNLTNDSAITWIWGTNYWLDIDSGTGGEVDTPSGWVADGQSVTSTAIAHPYYRFAGWTGDTQGDTNAEAMSIDMNGPCSLTANFWADLAVNDVPKAWLTANGLTNATPDEEALADSDGDFQDAWQEFFAGTDPNDPSSLFEIKDFGQQNGSNYVVWLGGTNGSALPFTVLGCTNLFTGWTVLDGNVERSESGTNTWWGTGSAESMFWRIKVNTAH
jgi:hypothetical protein